MASSQLNIAGLGVVHVLVAISLPILVLCGYALVIGVPVVSTYLGSRRNDINKTYSVLAAIATFIGVLIVIVVVPQMIWPGKR
tara:strand:+ start:628 stop:876 length:249 start_codon:yes stop_codon:yes gene_type:complete